MKLCPKAVAIKAGYWDKAKATAADPEFVQLAIENDKKMMARHLQKHMAYCRLCSK